MVGWTLAAFVALYAGGCGSCNGSVAPGTLGVSIGAPGSEFQFSYCPDEPFAPRLVGRVRLEPLGPGGTPTIRVELLGAGPDLRVAIPASTRPDGAYELLAPMLLDVFVDAAFTGRRTATLRIVEALPAEGGEPRSSTVVIGCSAPAPFPDAPPVDGGE